MCLLLHGYNLKEIKESLSLKDTSLSERGKIKWEELYTEAELYKAAIRLYTTPVFNWRKSLAFSSDGRNFYDFARRGLRKLGELHKCLYRRTCHFRPGFCLNFNFNGKLRTVYVYPWEERLIDLLLYRILNCRLNSWFSPSCYAYRMNRLGIDLCQKRIACALEDARKPIYVIKRDIYDYFNSIDHEILIKKVSTLVDKDDYLFTLLKERIEFCYLKDNKVTRAQKGIPFGTAVACLFANIYLTDLDRALGAISGLKYFRYSDDILFFSTEREIILDALGSFNRQLQELKLADKQSQRRDLIFSEERIDDLQFVFANKFKHLGLEFRANGLTGLSRDKCRKICNIFRYALRRKKGKIRKIKDIQKKTELVIEVLKQTLDEGIRNVAIIDYYLKHIKDEAQIKLLDRWLAEEALATILGNGHKKGNFRKISFETLRKKGLPSLLHRRRLLLHKYLPSSFFIWKNYKFAKAYKGMTARPFVQNENSVKSVFSPFPEAAAINPSERRGCL